ncbi:MAG: DEAD/DEAH box helicase [Prochlorothrix sp.]|nr:DEAD/DEAH box helicase [Prochlorothrix sp.]
MPKSAATADTATQRQSILAAYRDLSAPEQQFVQLMATIYQPITPQLLQKCVTDLGIKDQNRKPLSSNQIQQRLQRFMRLGVVSGSSSGTYRCHVLIVELIAREAVQQGNFDRMVKIVHDRLPLNSGWGGHGIQFTKTSELTREVRIALYQRDFSGVMDLWEQYIRYSYGRQVSSLGQLLKDVCTNPFDRDWIRSLSPTIYAEVMQALLDEALETFQPHPGLFELLLEDCRQNHLGCTADLRRQLACHLFLRGEFDAIASVVVSGPTALDARDVAVLEHTTVGLRSLLRGEFAEAGAAYNLAFESLRRTSKKRKLYLQPMEGLFYVATLIQEGSAMSLHQAILYCANQSTGNYGTLDLVYAVLEMMAQVRQGHVNRQQELEDMISILQRSTSPFQRFWSLLVAYWSDRSAAFKLVDHARKVYSSAEAGGYGWLATEAATFLSQWPGGGHWEKKGQQIHGAQGTRSLLHLLEPQEAWQLRLKALIGLQADPAPASVTQSRDRRMAWFLQIRNGFYNLTPKEQKISAKGNWSKGRNVALKRLKEASIEFDYLTPQDIQICNCLEVEYSTGYYGSTSYAFSYRAMLALVGHPRVFWEDTPTVRVDVVQGEPEVRVRKIEEDWLKLEMHPPIDNHKDIVIWKETPTRVVVFPIKEEHHNIAQILGADNHLRVPVVAQEQVLSAISAISGIVTIQSDIGGDLAGAREVEAVPTPLVHLLPAGQGLKAALLVRPFGQGGPYYRPGHGGETVVGEVDQERLQTTRNRDLERELAEGVQAACPHLDPDWEQDGEWLLEDPESCLELLVELQALGDQVIVEWPEGQTFKLKRVVSGDNLNLRVGQQKDWFAASGTLQVSEDLVLDIRQLMQLMAQGAGRFVKLDDGQFLALTDSFRKRLEELQAFSEPHGKGLRFHPLAAFALEDLVEEAGSVTTDRHWKAHIQRLREMEDLHPEVPSTLQGELRDYQLEGFQWLSRLAHWGVGACLADDMGLGKTLQALTLILTRAPQGPTLIVAPTSVCWNWLSEAQRFAPTLNAVYLGGDRQKLLDAVQPFDMVVCSYGLLQQEEVATMLAEVEWETIVLDEAQAIKNAATKRSKAAMALQGKFKILTTGTPIENHLGELWNLFRFINPGLLGSVESFNEKFANPIERSQDRAARQKLKKLIQPFILRRTKTQVLEELPSRTEITLQVEMSREEMAFYEALRMEALDKLAEAPNGKGPQHLQVLAEIMRLRRACCNSRLVVPESPIPSAKLQAFSEVLEELLENNHKALVFSQFVDHLKILENHLKSKSISYQYLDGSTPAKERQKRVTAFQSGEGEVFLISLKAGGTGLNLTAADYVIHMDPWWNPAVEDQASDRAHRLGQQRPVTVYRLVAQGTIEEKIVELHQHKRDLADSLLEGTEMSGKMSTDELLNLLSES